jgi:7-cyano-7-deazaguanine synthase
MNLEEIKQTLPELKDDENIAIALSGGLDSTTLAYVLVSKYGKDKVKALSFDFGQLHNIELDMAKRTAKLLGIYHDTIKLDYLADISRKTSSLIAGSELKPKTAEENSGDPQVNTYVPFRNAQFAFISAAFAETQNCRYIAQGLNAVDEYGYWDTTLEFTDRINNVLELNRVNPIKFIAPFVELYKDEELRLARELSEIYNFDILLNTWSCYNGDNGSGKECFVCNTCQEKATGYVQAGYTDEEIQLKFDVSNADLQAFRNKIKG